LWLPRCDLNIHSMYRLYMCEKGKQRPDRNGQLVENLPTPWRFSENAVRIYMPLGPSVIEGCLKYIQCFVSTTFELTFWLNITLRRFSEPSKTGFAIIGPKGRLLILLNSYHSSLYCWLYLRKIKWQHFQSVLVENENVHHFQRSFRVKICGDLLRQPDKIYKWENKTGKKNG